MSMISGSSNLQVNISSLIGQLTLGRTEASLTQSIRNLSSGLRIHSGRDDPVGFVAASSMRTEIASLNQAVTNCERAGAAISTADSALSTLNNLLIDLRGLVTQAANTGAENSATLAALQLEADAILNTIDYIAQSTSFLGQNLIDGSLDFTTYGVDDDKIAYLDISQANFLGRTEKDISIKVLESPQRAELYYSYGALKNSVILDIGGQGGYQTFQFDKDATVEQIADAVNRFSDATGVGAKVYEQSTTGVLAMTSYGKDNDVILSASQTGAAEGNFVVRYTAPREGNANLHLNVTEGTGNEPTVIEVVLQTELWQNAEYRFSGGADGDFVIAAKHAGAEFNDMEFVINNIYGTNQRPGVDVDLQSEPKKFQINVSYNAANPSDPSNTTVDQLADLIAASPVAGAYFELRSTPPSDGSGPVVPGTRAVQSAQGVDGGAVLTTANDVVTLINTAQELKGLDGTGTVTATIPSGTTGRGVVSPFSEFAYYGDSSTSNYLQFLAPEGSPSIQFVSTPGTPLSIDDTTHPPVYGKASTLIQGLDPGTSFTLKALQAGTQDDGVAVFLRDAADESVVFDAQTNAVYISVDFSGRAADPTRDALTMDDLVRMVSEDPFVGSRFALEPLTPYDPGSPPAFEHSGYLGIDTKVGETSGGLVSQGTVLIHLETDVNGIVKTTANDLVKFFNDPSTEASRQVLDRLGISVSVIDPNAVETTVCTRGLSSSGTGLLQPTYDPDDCTDTAGRFPHIVFASKGNDVREDYPSATVQSQNGLAASFTVTSRQSGALRNDTTVRIVSDATGPNVSYDPDTKSLVIGIRTGTSVTANDVIAMINDDPQIGGMFFAANASGSTGTGSVAVGDRATLGGGIQPVENRASAEVVSSNGLNALFEVRAKKVDDRYDGTEIRIVADSNGPTVSYDAATNQLTIGVQPDNPSTALEIVAEINKTEGVRELFEASIPSSVPGTTLVPTGEAAVHVGDAGTLRIDTTHASFGAAMLGAGDRQSLGITFYSLEFGSQAFVSVSDALNSGFTVTDRQGKVVDRAYGSDVEALINNQKAIGNGRVVSMATSDLDIAIWLDPDIQSGDVTGFRITGGGAIIQLGPDAVSSQQARIAIKNMQTVSLGGINGNLSDIRKGGPYDLLTNTSMAFKIIDEVSTEISSLRGRLGAFQKNQLETSKENMVDAIEIESEALSSVADTDFATESSNLLRQQLLMQANISVLQQSGQMSQMLLGLLQR